jgi:hypothetical protein
MLQRVAGYFLARPLLLILLVVDFILIAIHVWLWSRGNLPLEFHLGRQVSYAERFQYLKWLASTLLCAFAFAHRRDALYLAWAALFLYLLLDDSLEIHEALGPVIAEVLERGPAYGLRGKDFGEITVSLGAAALLLGFIAFCYRRSRDDSARVLTLVLLPWLAVLALCGIGVDVAKRTMRVSYDEKWAVMTAGVVEDGGEMIAASFLTATVARAALMSTRDSRSKPVAGGPMP